MSTVPTYRKAVTLRQALEMAQQTSDDFRFLAGGTDLMVNKFQGNEKAIHLIDISELEEIQQVEIASDSVTMGAGVTLSQLENNPEIGHHFPILIQAIQSIASPTLRNTATLAGNLLCENRCQYYNQSEWWRTAAGMCLKNQGDICLATGGKKHCYAKFVSDTAVALISLKASIVIAEGTGTRQIPLEELYTGDGISPVHINRKALITSIIIPLNPDCKSVYFKLRKRETLDFSSLTLAMSLDGSGKLRIVLGGAHAKPVVVEVKQDQHPENIIQQVVSETRIIDNDTYQRNYRRQMVDTFLRKGITALFS